MDFVRAEIDPKIYFAFEGLNVSQPQAIAEFIDNSIQSFLDYEGLLINIPNYKFKVTVDFEWGETKDHKTPANKIIIRDNAAGLDSGMLSTAFITAKTPTPQKSDSLNEWGMGMKTMACWLCRKLTMSTRSISEHVERSLVFDKNRLAKQREDKIAVKEQQAKSRHPYTEIILEDLVERNRIYKSGLSAIKKTLSSIYRTFLRTGKIQIFVDGEQLFFEEYDCLVAPEYKDPNGQKEEWKQAFIFEAFGKRIKGFIGCLREMKREQKGFVLIRRGRVIMGEDSKTRVYIKELCGQEGSPQDNRIYGEFTVEGFDTTFNKNGIAQDNDLQNLFKLIAKKPEVKRVLNQAKNYRKEKPTPPDNPDQKFYEVYTSVMPSLGGVVKGAGKFKVGSLITLVATPNSGYAFRKWDDGTLTPEKKFTLSNDVKITAKFDKVDDGPIPPEPPTPEPPKPEERYPDGALLDKFNIRVGSITYELYIRIGHHQECMLSQPSINGKMITIRFNNKKSGLSNPEYISDDVKTIIINTSKSLVRTSLEGGKLIDFIDNLKV